MLQEDNLLIRESGPTEAGGFTSDQTMSTRTHANTRGQRHQWRVGLTAWTEASQSRTAVIRGMPFSVSSSLRKKGKACFSLASCLWLNGLFEAPNRRRIRKIKGLLVLPRPLVQGNSLLVLAPGMVGIS